MDKRPIIIDCDTGTDDAIAIIAALYCKDANVLAITSVNGNVPHEWTSKNNLDIIEYLGFDNVPVAKGAYASLSCVKDYYGATHGATGMGSVMIPAANHTEFAKENAIETIRKYAEQYAGELELFVVGPMTNIAMLISLYPEVKNQIKHIYFMGGAAVGGNVTTTAEFNIWVDPVAAKFVIGSGIPMTMVGLDVTEKAVLSRKEINECREINTKASNLTADLLEFMTIRCKDGGEDLMMHDALAVASAFCPECLEFGRYFVDVECFGYAAGHTMVDLKGKKGKEPNVDVAMKVNLDKFKEWLMGCIRNSADVE